MLIDTVSSVMAHFGSKEGPSHTGNWLSHTYIKEMMDLIIGLLFGFAAACAIVVMWRMAENLRRESVSVDEAQAKNQYNESAD